MHRNRLVAFSALTLVVIAGYFFSSPVLAGNPNEEGDTYIDINEDTIWHRTDDLNLAKTVYVNPGATLTIESGADIKFRKDLQGSETYLLISGGRLVAKGTQKEPIRITAEADNRYNLIEFTGDNWEGIPDLPPSFLRYVEIYGGGYEWDTGCSNCSAFLSKFFSTARAALDGLPAVSFLGGKVHLENCSFYDNTFADIGIQHNEFSSDYDPSDYLEVVNSNFKKNGNSLAVRTELYCREDNYLCMSKFLLKDNWYDSEQGPYQTEIRENADGKEVASDLAVDGWRSNSMIADPVIILPGITGSAEVDGELKIDPIFHTYDDLIKSLESNGYKKDKNLFAFPYEWRNSNVITAKNLQLRVDEIVSATKISKADLVAHSMGGLVARSYIESDNYENNIDQLITLGTPHNGSPEAYLKWEAGEGFLTMRESLARHHFEIEALHKGHSDIFSYIQDDIPSVRELLPIYNYISDAGSGAERIYPSNYPQNIFLENLNKQENLEKLKKVDFINIIGALEDDKSTISGMRVVDSTVEDMWKNGMPENFYDSRTDRGLEKDMGDGTVPLESANNVPANKILQSGASHGDLPTVSQCAVLFELTGKTDCAKIVETHIPNILMFNVFSPIDIQIVDPNGKRVGKDFVTGEIFNEISGAYYSGYKTDSEFLTIPNPIDGEYKILTQGTGDGDYRVKVSKITEDPNDSRKAIESTQSITGVATPNQETEKSIEVQGMEVITEQKDTTPPIITITTPKTQDYLNNQILKFNYTVTDDESGVDTQSVMLDGNMITDSQGDLSLQKLGKHQFNVFATDKVGNQSEKAITFNLTTSLDAIRDNIKHFADLKLIKNSQEEKFLLNQLKLIDLDQEILTALEKQKKPNFLAKLLMKSIKSKLEHRIEVVIAHVEKSRLIEMGAKGLLVESLDSLK